MGMNRQRRGREGELLSESFLKKQGIEILAKNFRCPLGEIDLVGLDGDTIVFVEVRSRSSRAFGLPQESITRSKRIRLTKLAQWYLKQHGLEGRPARFDVIAILWTAENPQVTWIANAFEAVC